VFWPPHFLRVTFGDIGHLGATRLGSGIGVGVGLLVEVVLTTGLVSVILGTASGARNIGANAPLVVARYIILAGLWAAPVTGASMNPVRSLGPTIVGGQWGEAWIYVVGPLVGAALALAIAWVLRGPPSSAATEVAQGSLQNILENQK
jgi:aquaporin Z